MIRILLSRSRVGGFCVCLLLAASQTWGLGLGEIEVDSALNEKLNAEIELIDASGLQPAEILVSLASNEDFKRVGVERLFQLTDLSFEVTYGSRGIATIAVTSSRPITEPYLNFLVEVLWPSGRLLKEYTLLLDPPTFSPAPAPAVSAPRRSEAPSQSAGRVARPEPARPATQVQIAPKPQESAPRSRPQSELMTGRNDTLWAIASNTLPTSAATVQQKMLAIQRLNERAFINNNINLLKAGYLLRLPSESEARTLSEREAVAMVATQHDATGAREARESEVASSSGELRIVAGSGESATGTAQASDGDLNSALEETDRLGREVDELTYQLDREQELAGNQLEVKDRQLAVKDQQIAELQPQMAQLQQQISEQPQNQNQSALAPASGGPWWQSPYMLGGVAGVLVLALVGGLIAARRNREASDEFDSVQEVVFEERSKPELAQVEQQLDEELSEFEMEADNVVDVSVADDGVDEESPTDQDSFEDDLDHEEVGVSQTGDVIGEADIYIAYGRYPQAIGLLLGVLENDADRNDVRLKLLELFVETNDREAFESHMAELVDRCDDDDALLTAREFESRLGENDLEAGLSSEATSESDEVENELDELTDVDDFDLDLDADIDDGAALEELDQDDSIVEFDIGEDSAESPEADADQLIDDEPDVEALNSDDVNTEESFELELDEVEDLAEAEEGDLGSGDELGGDLGIDFNPDGNLTAESDDTVAEPVSGAAAVSTTADTLLTNKLEDTEFETEVATVEEDEFEFDDEGDSANTKLDLARAYIDMGDEDGARDILKEVLEEGSSDQQQQAQSILEGL